MVFAVRAEGERTASGCYNPAMVAPDRQSVAPLGRWFFVRAIIPAFFAWLDDRLLMNLSLYGGLTTVTPLLIALVVQVGLFGVLCARLIDWPAQAGGKNPPAEAGPGAWPSPGCQ